MARAGSATVTRIGVTGHSDLTPSSLPVVESALRDWLSGRTGPGWVGVSCLARGTDQIFAGLVLAGGGLLEVILPAHDYRQRKVEPDNAAEFDLLLAAAATVTVLDFERSCRQAYMSASTDMLAAVDMLVAVWDGKPPHRHGSTGDVVDAARSSGLPVSVIWPPAASRDDTTQKVAPPGPSATPPLRLHDGCNPPGCA